MNGRLGQVSWDGPKLSRELSGHKFMYVPLSIWREIGLSLLEDNNIPAFHDFCMTCRDTHKSMEREHYDLFGKPVPHLKFKSSYLLHAMCIPFVEKLRQLVHNMETAPLHTTLWLNGGVGDIEETILQLTTHISNRLVLHCNESEKSVRLQTSRIHRIRPPLFLILLGCDETALVNNHVKGWVVNQRGMKVTLILVSPHTVINSPAVACNMDRIVRIDGTLVWEEP